MRRVKARVRSTWRALRRRHQLDAAMHDEMRFHIDMEAERLIREQGLDVHEARRRAYVAFGGVENYKEEARDTRGLQWIDAVSLDARLAVRMLVKHRWLTVVGGFAMAVAIAVGATGFEVISELLNPALPFADGDRVIALQNVESSSGRPERRVLRDFAAWRDALVSVNDLAAFRTAQYNLVSGNAPPEPVKVAEITASGFLVARTRPLLGRHLIPADERADAQPVIVLGHSAWQSRFGGDAHIVGRPINLGGASYAVVGVMPVGFRFPIDHEFWIPLRDNPLQHAQLQGPELYVFGRLARGATLGTAQAELTTIGQRAAAAYPATHARLRPVVLPYTREHLDLAHPTFVWLLRMAQLLIGALSFVVAVNLAILVYARTVARLGEIAVRTALGASRRRILVQLFVEALALSVVGAAIGLVLADITSRRIGDTLLPANGSVPFWLNFDLSIGTVIYAFGLAVLAAVIMGVLPGLKATGTRLNTQLRELSGRTGARLGPVWTALVVAQVAVAVAVLPVAVLMAWQVMRMELAGSGFAAERFVVSSVVFSGDATAADSNRTRAHHVELMSRVDGEPGVSAVTFSSSIPGFAGDRRIRFAEGTNVEDATPEVSSLSVDVDLFDIYGISIVAGRGFRAADVGAANTVIVNRSFMEQLAKNLSPLGLRFRYLRPQGAPPAATNEWYQIVGVVADFPSFPSAPGANGSPTVYHAMAAGDADTIALSVRFSGSIPAGFIARFREIAAEVDPAMQLRRVVLLDEFYDEVRSLWRFLAWGIGLVTASVLVLSAAGIYALMSFTVALRAREIGIRAALGAAPHRLLLSIFGPVTRQLSLGLLVGSLLSGALVLTIDLNGSQATNLLLAVATIMVVVGLLAAIGPARRSLHMPASEALKADT